MFLRNQDCFLHVKSLHSLTVFSVGKISQKLEVKWWWHYQEHLLPDVADLDVGELAPSPEQQDTLPNLYVYMKVHNILLSLYLNVISESVHQPENSALLSTST